MKGDKIEPPSIEDVNIERSLTKDSHGRQHSVVDDEENERNKVFDRSSNGN